MGRMWCEIFECECDEVTQMDVEEFNDLSVCDGECERCWNCSKD